MKILLVDDSRTVALLTMARLESFGHDVEHVMSGEQAIAVFQQQSFDLILMDVEMPGMNGFETTTRIRAHEGLEPWAWTPIIFVTGTDSDSNLAMAIEAGGDDFISKRVSETVLRAKMKAMERIAGLRSRLSYANRKLQEQANFDGLTGLMNRRAMDMQLDNLWEKAVRSGKPFSLLLIDADNFRKYNEHYGHAAGDDCLRQVASCLAEVIRSVNEDQMVVGAFVARYGGEEFAVVIPDAPPGVHAGVAESLICSVAALKLPHLLNADLGVVTISVGAVATDCASGPISLFFRRAEDLLYQAKAAGLNRAEIG